MVTSRVPGRALDDADRVERRAHRGEVLRGVGLAQRAAEGASVADGRVGDDALGVAEDREQVPQQLGLEELAVARHRADPYDVAVGLDEAEGVVQVVDVDEVLRGGQPELHHRQQAVPPGDHPGLLAQPLEEPDGVLDAGGPGVLDRRGHLHAVIVGSRSRALGARTAPQQTRPAGPDPARVPRLTPCRVSCWRSRSPTRATRRARPRAGPTGCTSSSRDRPAGSRPSPPWSAPSAGRPTSRCSCCCGSTTRGRPQVVSSPG